MDTFLLQDRIDMDINFQTCLTKGEHRLKIIDEYVETAWLIDRRLARIEKEQKKPIRIIRTKETLMEKAKNSSTEFLEAEIENFKNQFMDINIIEWKHKLKPILTVDEFLFDNICEGCYRLPLTKAFVSDVWLYDRRIARINRLKKRPVGTIRSVDQLQEEAQSYSFYFLKERIREIKRLHCELSELEWKYRLPPFKNEEFTLEEEDSTSPEDKKREKENKWKTIREKVKKIGKIVMRK